MTIQPTTGQQTTGQNRIGQPGIGAAAKEALDFLAAEWWPVLVVAVVPELLSVVVAQGFWALTPSNLSQINGIEGAAALLLRIFGALLATVVVAYFIRAFAWGAMSELLAQRGRGEPRNGMAALVAATKHYGSYFRSYGAFIIPAATVVVVAMVVFALLFLGAFYGGALGWVGALRVGGLVAMLLLPFWLWAEAFEYLIAPASVGGEFGLSAYRAMRQRVRGQWLPLIGLRIFLFLAGIVASIVGWIFGLALPSAPDTDWQKYLNLTPEDLPKLLGQMSLVPDRWEWAHALVGAVPDAFVFAFGAITAWCWLRDRA